MFFSFPEDARWNPNLRAVEFGVGIGGYEGVVRVPRNVFRRFIDGAVTPEKCLEAYHLQRTRFELVVERKLRRRQLTDDGNVEISGRDLRERQALRLQPPNLVDLHWAGQSAMPIGASRCASGSACQRTLPSLHKTPSP
jgi:hypothetical protein